MLLAQVCWSVACSHRVHVLSPRPATTLSKPWQPQLCATPTASSKSQGLQYGHSSVLLELVGTGVYSTAPHKGSEPALLVESLKLLSLGMRWTGVRIKTQQEEKQSCLKETLLRAVYEGQTCADPMHCIAVTSAQSAACRSSGNAFAGLSARISVDRATVSWKRNLQVTSWQVKIWL